LKPIVKHVAHETLHDAKRQVIDSLRQRTQSFIGASANVEVLEAVRATIAETLKEMMAVGRIGPSSSGLEELTAVLMLDFRAPREAHDQPNPKLLMEKVPTFILDAIMGTYEGTVKGALSFVFLEHAKRHGHIKDWNFTWRSDGMGGDTLIVPKDMIQFVTANITVKTDPTG
jgi:hypothetical protein